MNWLDNALLHAYPNKEEVICWRVLVDRLDDDQFIYLYASLTFEEKARANAFLKPADKNRYIAAHGVLHILVKRILGFEAHIGLNEFGKPQILNSTLQFNLSHSGNVILIAFSFDAPIGVDVEQERVMTDMRLIARNYFHPLEVQALNELDQSLLSQAFFSCWSKKESVVKALGLGLSLPLDSFRVDIHPLAGECAVSLADKFPQSWTLRVFCPLPGYAASLAAPYPSLQIKGLDFDYAAMQQLVTN